MGALAHLPVEGGGENTCSKDPPARLTWALSLEEKAYRTSWEGGRRLCSGLPPNEWFYYIFFSFAVSSGNKSRFFFFFFF